MKIILVILGLCLLISSIKMPITPPLDPKIMMLSRDNMETSNVALGLWVIFKPIEAHLGGAN